MRKGVFDMLSSILSGKTCAACQNCCIFEERSAWELPTFSEAAVSHLPKAYKVIPENGRYRIKLPYDETHAAQPCPFLDPRSGCTLPPEEKPFACSLWPVRLMRNADGKPVLTLYHGCPGVGEPELPALRALLRNGLRGRIFREAEADPSIILPYHPNYIYLEQELNNMKQLPQPEAVFRYFEELSAIPHGSGNTGGIRKWALETAAKLSLDAHADETGNVIIRKAASAGYEQHPAVIIQGHLDMVCAKLPDCAKDMETEGLSLVWGDEFLSAEGTTLGGDDGIAVAYAFALLESDSIPHPPLTVILTVDEETGMDGASGLSPDELDGAYLINIDSEEEGIFTVGCAGGVRSHLNIPVQASPADGTVLRLTLSGLTGGHSGAEIHKPLLNANLVMLRLLQAMPGACRLCAWDGGIRDNVIPAECTASILCESERTELLMHAAEEALAQIRGEYPNEQGIQLVFDCTENARETAVTAESSRSLLDVLATLPNGVQEMNGTLHMPETSLNLGIMKLCPDGMRVDALIRSGVDAKKEQLAKRLAEIAADAGGTVSESGDYPAWEYVPGTALEAAAADVFRAEYGREPVIQTIHAGLECGLFAAKIPDLDAISFGPQMYDIHTTREKLSLGSTARTWELLKKTLEMLKLNIS